MSEKAKATTASSYAQISHAAYLNYASRRDSGTYGDELGDWLAAEAQLLEKQK